MCIQSQARYHHHQVYLNSFFYPTGIFSPSEGYRAELHMVAIILMMGIRYACNRNYYEDQMWWQSSFQKGPNILAILTIKGTKYSCNLNSERDLIWLQSLLIGNKYDCNIENRPKSRDYAFWTNLAKSNFRRLQAYLVHIEIDCKHLWSVLDLRLQAYLVHFET